MDRKNIEDLYELSPMQQGMLFHTLYNPDSPAYFNQLAGTLEGPLQREAFERAWQDTAKRHSVLRTAFLAERSDKALQVVLRNVTIPIRWEDWRDVNAPERDARLKAFLVEDQRQGFELSSAPLMRLSVVQVAEEEHVLVWSHHHLLLDGWSLPLLIGEVFTRYEDLCAGQQSRLDPVPPYRSYIAWLQEQDRTKAEQFWKHYLAGFTAATPLPTSAAPMTRGGEQRGYAQAAVELSADATAALQAQARQSRVTLSTITQAAWAYILSRYSREEDVVFGATVSGRPADLVGSDRMVGLFINTLPVRVKIDENARVADWFAALHQQQQEARDFDWSPLAQVQKWSDIPPRTSLFQSILVFENYPSQMGARNSASVQVRDINVVDWAHYPLTVIVTPGDTLSIRLKYDTGLFDADTIERMAAHFQTLLTAIAADPECKVSALPMLDEPERQHLIEGLNATSVEYNEPRFIHQLFEAEAASHPEAPAVIFEGVTVSYGELNARANQLAHWLQAQGVTVDTLVGVSVERSVEMVVALMAIVKAGGAYVPVDPEYPLDRQKYLLADSGVTLVLTQEKLRERLESNCSARLLCLDSEWEQVAKFGGTSPICGVVGGNLAYMIYTSGSTGRPKGAMNTHEAILNRLLWMQDAYGINASDRVLQKTPFSFDVSVWEFFWPLMTGAALVVARPGGHRDSAYLAELIEREQVTTLHFVPSMLQQFVEEPGLEAKCRSLRRVICSGEALPWELERRFYSRLGAELHNLYGPTEAAVDVTYWACPHENERGIVPIGRPIANTQIYVLDGNLEPVPVGVAGEVHIGGINLARGYWGRAELTAEKFIPNPFGAGRLYKTGDLGRWNSEGAVEYLGRLDHQVKIRGFRIELGEIETALREHASVKDAVVIARGEGSAKRLVGYVVPEAGAEIDASELRSHLKVKLPEYMVPWPLVTLEALPLSPNGKLDRKALPEIRNSDISRAAALPETAEEQALAEIWTAVLGLEQIDVEANFFDLGGDSIRSLQVLGAAKKRDIHFTLQQLFAHPTIRDLVRELTPNAKVSTSQVLPFSLISEADRGRMPAEVEDAYPLTMLQAGMLFHSDYDEHSAAYHVVTTTHLRTELDIPTFREAVRIVTANHPVLRTSFDLTQFQEPLQLVWKSCDTPVVLRDISHLNAGEQAAAIAAWYDAETQDRMDWTRPPLLRFTIHLRGERDFQLSWTQHHAILDGWSVATFLSEVFTTYFDLFEGRSAGVPVSDTSFREFVALERESLASSDTQDFWRANLAGASSTQIPRWPERFGAREPGIVEMPVAIPDVLEGKLKKLAQATGAQLKSVLLAAHMRALSLISGTTDVLTGVVFNGRPERDGAERGLGLFLNTLPVRQHLAGGTWVDLIKQVARAEQQILAHRRYPMAQLQRDYRGDLEFETGFNYTHFHVYQGLQANKRVEVVDSKHFSETNFTLVANFTADPNTSKLQLTLSCAASELPIKQREQIAAYYLRILEQMTKAPNERYDRSDTLIPRDNDVLKELNATTRSFADDVCLHELFEQTAAANPSAIAAVFENESITYTELNQRANRLAHELLASGVRPDSRVALSVERSIHMLVGVLGILKAGAAYVPVDQSLPVDRIEWMLSDMQADALVTTSSLRDALPVFSGITVLADRLSAIAPALENPRTRVGASNAAYVIYTSGSTGLPKGVVVEHRSAVNYLQWADRVLAGPAGTWLPVVTRLSFDAVLKQLFVPLLRGTAVWILPEDVVAHPHSLVDALASRDAVILNCVPSLWRACLSTIESERDTRLVGKLKRLLLGGEELRPEMIERTLAAFPEVEIWNLYGPTEATANACAAQITSPSAISIGRPVDNLALRVVDVHGRPAPIGVPGELTISGPGVARGYLNRPSLTAERFVPGNADAGRTYRTGDRARVLPDGTIEFLGRSDNQVKVRGFRIELGEIEAAINAHPFVQESVVLARESEDGGSRLAAWVVPKRKHGPALDGHQRYRLPNNLQIVHLNTNETDFLYKEVFLGDEYTRHGVGFLEGDCVFDVGANIGMFTLLAHTRTMGGAIYSFDPNPYVYELMRRNRELYGVRGEAFNCGLSQEEKTAEFTFYPKFSILSGLYGDEAEERELVHSYVQRTTTEDKRLPDETFESSVAEIIDEKLRPQTFPVRLRRLSDCIRESGVERIDFLKINVEKAEWDVIAGMTDDDWRKVQQFAVEVHDTDGRLARITEILDRHGFIYTVEQDWLLQDSMHIHYVYALRPERKARLEAAAASGNRAELIYEDSILTEESVRAHLRAKLPEYMVPSEVALIEGLPLLPNGKLDRRALETRETAGSSEARTVVAPRDEVELEILRMWEAALRKTGFGVCDNLFEVGGDSLTAARLTVQINRRFNSRLSVAALLQASTVEKLASAVRSQGGVMPWSPLVPIQAGGSLTPLFCVHPIGGTAMCYWDLARQLGPDQPVYGLQSRALVAELEPETSIEQMAASYLTAIRTVQKSGPYRLAGWSFGGVVAFEMARQLAAAGEEVETLALIDSPPPGAPVRRLSDVEFLAELATEVNAHVAEEALQGLDTDACMNLFLDAARAAGGVPAEFDRADLDLMLRCYQANTEALANYSPKMYSGSANLYQPVSTKNPLNAVSEWERSVQALTTQVVPGTHGSMMRTPDVEALAAHLNEALAGNQKSSAISTAG